VPLFGDLASGQSQSAIGPGHSGGIQALEFAPDGRTLATSGSDRAIRYWDVETRAERSPFLGAEAEAVALSFSPDGRRLVCVERGNAVTVWDMAAGDFVLRLGPSPQAPLDVRVSPDGSTLATRAVGRGPDALISFWPAPRED
jgi:WD40 repeat protein